MLNKLKYTQLRPILRNANYGEPYIDILRIQLTLYDITFYFRPTYAQNNMLLERPMYLTRNLL